MEVNGHCEGFFQLRHQGVDARGAYEAGHVLECDHLCAEAFHLFGLLNEVFVSEDFLVFGSAFGVNGVADGSVSDAAEFVDEADRLFYVVDVVEGIKYTHHIQTVLDSLFVEAFEYLSGVGDISEEVSAAREGRKQRDAFHLL